MILILPLIAAHRSPSLLPRRYTIRNTGNAHHILYDNRWTVNFQISVSSDGTNFALDLSGTLDESNANLQVMVCFVLSQPQRWFEMLQCYSNAGLQYGSCGRPVPEIRDAFDWSCRRRTRLLSSFWICRETDVVPDPGTDVVPNSRTYKAPHAGPDDGSDRRSDLRSDWRSDWRSNGVSDRCSDLSANAR